MNKNRRKKSDKNLRLLFFLSIPVLILAGIVLPLIQAQQSQRADIQAAYRLTNCTVSAADMAIKPSEQEMLTFINNYRNQQAGAQPLTMDTNLKRAAQWHANDMSAKGYLEVVDLLGRNPEQRLGDCGFTGYTKSATSIQQGTTNAEAALSVWRGEEGDNESMLNPAFTVVGIALSGTHWVAVYADSVPATPAPTFSCLGACPTIKPTTPVVVTPPDEEDPLPTEGEEPLPPEGEEGEEGEEEQVPPEGEAGETPTGTQPTGGVQTGGDITGGNTNATKFVLLIIIFLTIFLGFKPLLHLLKHIFKRP